jgi:hypothetical protein
MALANLPIGVVGGFAFNRYARNWLARLGGSAHSDTTSADGWLACAFVGFHLGVVLGVLPSPLMFYLAPVVAAQSSSFGCGAVARSTHEPQ